MALKGEKVKLFISMCLTICVLCSVFVIGVSAAEFTDVSEDNWFCNEVNYVCGNGLMNGVGNDKFDSNGTMTRAMIVTVLHRLSGEEDAVAPCGFADVKSGSYYDKAVAWAAEHGIVTGYSEAIFGPNDPITREQMAAILYRYAKTYEYDTAANADISAYSDYDEIGSYAISAMQWANGAGLITGTSATTLSPKGNATRAQVATILYRFCEQLAKPEEAVKTYTVTFMFNYEDAGEYKTEKVEDGKTIDEPIDPAREGYDFLGWFTKSEGGREFDFDTKITEDIELYAHWEKVEEDPEKEDEKQDEEEQNPEEQEKPDEQPEEDSDEIPEIKGNNVFLLTQANLEDNKTVSVTLFLCGDVELCGFDMELSYDDEKLALKDLNTKCDLSLVSSTGDGIISFNYAGVSNVTKEKVVLTAVFDVIAEDSDNIDISLTPIEVIKTDENSYDVFNVDHCIEYFGASF